MNPTDVSKAMNTLTHGVYVLGVHANDKDNLMTAAWLCQVASSPAMLVVAVSTGHLTADMIKEAGYFTVSVLKDTQKSTAVACGRVSGRQRGQDKAGRDGVYGKWNPHDQRCGRTAGVQSGRSESGNQPYSVYCRGSQRNTECR